MSVTFTKLFSSITESTIWCEPSDTRIVWITMLAMADRKGRVFGSIPGLANRAQVSVDATRAAIAAFLSPDPDSRTPDHEGKRIAPMDGGWLLLNHAKYRAIRDVEERRIYKTEKQREYRLPVDKSVDNVDQCGPQRTTEDRSGPAKTEEDSGGHNAEAEAEASVSGDTKKKNKARGTAEEIIAYVTGHGNLPASDGEWFHAKMEGAGWKNGGEPVRDWKSTVRAWKIAGYFPSQKSNGSSPHRNGHEATKTKGNNHGTNDKPEKLVPGGWE